MILRRLEQSERNVKMNPFNFNVEMSDKLRFKRRVIYSAAAVLLTAAFTVGFITVYVNTYNVIHDKPMKVFGLDKTEDSIDITVFNHYFTIPKNS